MNQDDHYPLEKLFGRILSPFEAFLQRTTAGGIILMGTAVLSLIIANLPWVLAFIILGTVSCRWHRQSSTGNEHSPFC